MCCGVSKQALNVYDYPSDWDKRESDFFLYYKSRLSLKEYKL